LISFIFFYFISYHFTFISDSNYHFDVCFYEKMLLLVLLTGVWCLSLGDSLAFFTPRIFLPF
jgi:hypothetical protein